MLHHCAFDDCPKTTEHWLDDGWANLSDFGRFAYYCREHADWLVTLLMSGELEEVQDRLNRD